MTESLESIYMSLEGYIHGFLAFKHNFNDPSSLKTKISKITIILFSNIASYLINSTELLFKLFLGTSFALAFVSSITSWVIFELKFTATGYIPTVRSNSRQKVQGALHCSLPYCVICSSLSRARYSLRYR